MAFDAPEELDGFRVEVRDWLEENCPAAMRTPVLDDEIVWGGRQGSVHQSGCKSLARANG